MTKRSILQTPSFSFPMAVTRRSETHRQHQSIFRSGGALALVAAIATIASSGCYRNVFGADLETCEEVNAAIKEELTVLQSCSVDADCGLVLEGTSCGCSNDLVARKEYDTTRLRALQGRADELKCTTATTDCSCPETNGFVCTDGVCGWNYVKP